VKPAAATRTVQEHHRPSTWVRNELLFFRRRTKDASESARLFGRVPPASTSYRAKIGKDWNGGISIGAGIGMVTLLELWRRDKFPRLPYYLRPIRDPPENSGCLLNLPCRS
jgi:hypothetical protein